jgi:hypothetical protein
VDKDIKYYAGIGSRETPLSLQPLIHELVELLNANGYTLRSGGAPGADTFFEEKAALKEIYLPWKGFNGNASPLYQSLDPDFYALCRKIAQEFHPNWGRLSWPVQKLMARNTMQIIGSGFNEKHSEFVVCWTKDGKASGGTGQALRIAKHYKIPIFNLFNEADVIQLKKNLMQTKLF